MLSKFLGCGPWTGFFRVIAAGRRDIATSRETRSVMPRMAFMGVRISWADVGQETRPWPD